MDTQQAEQFEYILNTTAIGIAIVDACTFHVHYMNSYLHALLDERWWKKNVQGLPIRDLLPEKFQDTIMARLQEGATQTGYQHYEEVPFEGFLELRGRTYWNITIERQGSTKNSQRTTLLIKIEDVTEAVRSRLHLNAIHAISSAIAGPSSLHLVLDRILQVLQEMFGSKRCCVMLLDRSVSGSEISEAGPEQKLPASPLIQRARIAAQKGLHAESYDWHPIVSETILLGQVMNEGHTLTIPDTRHIPAIELPLINYRGEAKKPGSVLSVPIFDPSIPNNQVHVLAEARPDRDHTNTILGTIEVYHRRARGFPAEEIERLEQFAQQAGLAIKNARLLHDTDHWARTVEAEVVSRTAELKQRNQALLCIQEEQAISNTRMTLLLERLPAGIILVAAQDTCIELINRQAVKLLRSIGASIAPEKDLEEACARAIGQNYKSIADPITWYTTQNTQITATDQPLAQALQGKSIETEFHAQKVDGQVIHLLVKATPVRMSDGTITSVILVYQEITRIKALERAREDFFTTMAHELKTPLANIRAHLSALLAKDLEWSTDERYAFLQTADEQVDRLVGMINYFLDASRVEAGALRLELEPLLIPELCEDLQERLEALISTSQRSLNMELSEGLPAVEGDYELIISVLSNLLSNAFRYTPEKDAVYLKARLAFDAQQQPQGVTFSVEDHGPGISQEQKKLLFTRFSTFAALNRPSIDRPGQPESARNRKASRWSPATGLGLYISRGIIEAHHSQLTVESSPGQGATFAFTLPLFHKKVLVPGTQVDANNS